MHSNLLISGIKTFAIACVLTLLINKFSCICEGQSWCIVDVINWAAHSGWPSFLNNALKVSMRVGCSNGRSGSRFLRRVDEQPETEVETGLWLVLVCRKPVGEVPASMRRLAGMELPVSSWVSETDITWLIQLRSFWTVGKRTPMPSGTTGLTLSRWRPPNDPDTGRWINDLSCWRMWQTGLSTAIPIIWTLVSVTRGLWTTPWWAPLLALTNCLGPVSI